MRGGREHRELGRWETPHVAVRLAAAEQTKELHRVRDAQAVCIPDQDQGGCCERRNGQGVDTPIGIRLAEGKAYFTTWSTTGKVKRLANNPRVTLASYAKMRRKVIGSTVEGIARRLEGTEAADVSARVLKPTFWRRLFFWRGISSTWAL